MRGVAVAPSEISPGQSSTSASPRPTRCTRASSEKARSPSGTEGRMRSRSRPSLSWSEAQGDQRTAGRDCLAVGTGRLLALDWRRPGVRMNQRMSEDVERWSLDDVAAPFVTGPRQE
jgi:hypothetical protein